MLMLIKIVHDFNYMMPDDANSASIEAYCKELQDVMSFLHSFTVLMNVMNMNIIECMIASIMVMIMKLPLKNILSISLDAMIILG